MPFYSRGLLGIINNLARITTALGYIVSVHPNPLVGYVLDFFVKLLFSLLFYTCAYACSCHFMLFIFNGAIIATLVLFVTQSYSFLVLRLVTYAKQRFDQAKRLAELDTSTDTSLHSHTDADVDDEVDDEDDSNEYLSPQERELQSATDRNVKQQQTQEQVASSRSRIRPIAFIVRVLMTFNSVFIQVVIMGLSVFVFCAVALALYFTSVPASADSTTRCNTAHAKIATIMMIAVLIGLSLILVSVVIDFITYAKDFFRCRCYKVFVTDEPMYFRLEMVLLAGAIVFFMSMVIIFQIVQADATTKAIASDLTRIIWDGLIILVAPCFALVITCYNDISTCFLKRKAANHILTVEDGNHDRLAMVDIGSYNPTVETIETLLLLTILSSYLSSLQQRNSVLRISCAGVTFSSTSVRSRSERDSKRHPIFTTHSWIAVPC